MAILCLAQVHSISTHVHSFSLNSLPSFSLSGILYTAMPPKKKPKTGQSNKQDFPYDKCNNVFHTSRAGFVLHYMCDCTAPPTRWEIPKRLPKKLISLNNMKKQQKNSVQDNNGFEYEPESTLRDHHGCSIVDVEGMYDLKITKMTQHVTWLLLEYNIKAYTMTDLLLHWG